MFQTLISPILQALPDDVVIQVRGMQSSLGTQQSSASSTPSYVLLAGHHFMIVAEGKVVLDHIFGGAQQQPSGGSNLSSRTVATGTRSGVLQPSTGASGQPSRFVPGRLPVAGKPSSSMVPGRLPVNRGATDPTDNSVTKQDSGTTMGAHAKTIGALTLHNVSPLLHPCPAELWLNMNSWAYKSKMTTYFLSWMQPYCSAQSSSH